MKLRSFSALKTLCVSSFVNLKIEWLQIKTISFIKLNVVSAKQWTLGNLNGILKCNQMSTKDVTKIVIVKRMKLKNTVKEDQLLLGSKGSC